MATMLPMMLLTGSVHPPGGALILTLPDSAKMQALSWWYMLCPGLLGLFVLLPLAKLCTTLKVRAPLHTSRR
jgi:CBS-domain-containing membrane protein